MPYEDGGVVLGYGNVSRGCEKELQVCANGVAGSCVPVGGSPQAWVAKPFGVVEEKVMKWCGLYVKHPSPRHSRVAASELQLSVNCPPRDRHKHSDVMRTCHVPTLAGAGLPDLDLSWFVRGWRVLDHRGEPAAASSQPETPNT